MGRWLRDFDPLNLKGGASRDKFLGSLSAREGAGFWVSMDVLSAEASVTVFYVGEGPGLSVALGNNPVVQGKDRWEGIYIWNDHFKF